MKKILLMMLVLAVLMMVGSLAFAGDMHGDLSVASVLDESESNNISTRIFLSYGLISNWCIYGSAEVLFNTNDYKQIFNIGTRMYFYKTFYVEFEHVFTHYVYSYSGSYNIENNDRTDIRIGMKW